MRFGQTVTISGPKGSLASPHSRAMSRTQVEVSRTDCFVLGIDPPVRAPAILTVRAVIKGPGELQRP